MNSPATLELREIAHWQYQVLVLHRLQACFLSDQGQSVDSACTLINHVTYNVNACSESHGGNRNDNRRLAIAQSTGLVTQVRWISQCALCDRTSRVLIRMFWKQSSNISLLRGIDFSWLHLWQIPPSQKNRTLQPWKMIPTCTTISVVHHEDHNAKRFWRCAHALQMRWRSYAQTPSDFINRQGSYPICFFAQDFSFSALFSLISESGHQKRVWQAYLPTYHQLKPGGIDIQEASFLPLDD